MNLWALLQLRAFRYLKKSHPATGFCRDFKESQQSMRRSYSLKLVEEPICVEMLQEILELERRSMIKISVIMATYNGENT